MHVRSLLALVLAAVLAAPAAAAAQARRGSTSKPAAAGQRPLIGGAWLGYEMGDLDGIQLRVEGELPFQQLSPQVGLSLVGALGYSRLGDETFGVDLTANVLKLVPAARFTLPLNPQLSVFGDAGLGLYWSSVEIDRIGAADADDSELGIMLRFGAGGLFTVNPRTNVGVQLVFDPMFGDALHSDTTFTLLAGLTYQL